jgi:hypothetical protein
LTIIADSLIIFENYDTLTVCFLLCWYAEKWGLAQAKPRFSGVLCLSPFFQSVTKLRSYNMVRKLFLIGFYISCSLLVGCVERKLTITTEPAGALVALNDEEIGTSPVTVGFEWYGDYNVRISKENYTTLVTHRNLPRPLRDKFPFDLLDDMFRTRVDEYAWNFKLEPYVPPVKEDMINRAVGLRAETMIDPNAVKPKNYKPKYPKPEKKKADKKKKTDANE